MIVASLGWLGTIIYLLNHSYISLQVNWRKSVYYSGNAIAAACLVASSFYLSSWQAVLINGFWLVISLLLLLQINLNKIAINKSVLVILLATIWLIIAAHYISSQIFSFTWLGWSSALVFCLSYLPFSTQKMSIQLYLAANTYAALALLPQLWLDANWPVFGLEIAWSLISVYGLIRRVSSTHLLD